MAEATLLQRAGVVGVVAVAAVGTAWALLPDAFPSLRAGRGPDPVPARPGTAAVPAAPPAVTIPPAVEATPEVPRFDVARVGARGMLVAAGRAAPGAEVGLLEGGRELGRARADARGQWVILPGEPLSPGAHELALAARSPGGDPIPGRETVLLVVPEPPPEAAAALARGGRPAAEAGTGSGGHAMALLLPSESGAAAPRLLQGGGGAGAAAPAEAGAGGQRLGLDVVEYDDAGALRFSGSAPPGARVRIYVGREHAGDAVADTAGRWQVTPAEQPGLGRHTLRVDQLAASGPAVAARVELPFQRDRLPPEALAEDGRLVVQPGHNLWRIARRVYGRGVRYTVIYQANREHLRDPGLIYPGQVLVVPGAGVEPPPPQAESRLSR